MQVILNSLVYEKQQRLRIIMKMHGLGDGPYWIISYAYFLALSTFYIIFLMIFGSVIGIESLPYLMLLFSCPYRTCYNSYGSFQD